MTLYINTSDFDSVEFILIGKQVKSFKKTLAFNENFRTLELLEKFLKNHKVGLKKIEKIIVCSGPGSFTGIRVGVAMAKALSFALQVPLTAIPKDKLPEEMENLPNVKLPKKLIINYGRKPNITKPKSQ
ncbi:hypothetical protein IPM19_04995 [bacterium]|nr:MAG: hypothetical protein IPM19_04995 [bacterium]